MTPNKPYLLRALYEWISDNGLTPYIVVDAQARDVVVPTGIAQDGKVTLNISASAVAGLDLGNEHIQFHARFSGTSQEVWVPVGAVVAIYAKENGQGMLFPEEESSHPPEDSGPDAGRPQLKVVK